MLDVKAKAVRKFVETWTGRGYEKGEAQSFWYQLLHDVFDVETPANFILFELPIHLKKQKFIDAYIPKTKVLIEQKSSSENLLKAKKQSDNQTLTPYEQALRYASAMKYSERPRWIITCNFQKFLIYDMENIETEPFEIELENLEREYHLLSFLVVDIDTKLRHEKEISIKAGELVARVYDLLHERYSNPQSANALKSLNILCVRLVFCLFAEDSGLFGSTKGKFRRFLSAYKPTQMRKALIDLFRILNTPIEERSEYEEDILLSFPYVNGGLFANNDIEIPTISDEIASILITECSESFDWSGISPTIFGALFEDTMNPKTRETGAMHYTSVKNIHRVIDPLFLNKLKSELNSIQKIKVDKERKNHLLAFQCKLASLKFLDPACGSGNFLTETYLSIRDLENQVIIELTSHKDWIETVNTPIKVSIENFYGMEVNDFAVTVAKAALWIAEAQMMKETEKIVKRDLAFLPLRSNSNIVIANALTSEWADYITPKDLSYIIGNPPFIGKKTRTEEQKKDLLHAIGSDSKRPGNMDIVSGWFIKAARYMQDTSVKAAFVSTINITRGEQVALLWDAMLNKYHCSIDFAYNPFIWNSESAIKAQVHCTIIGFSCDGNSNKKMLYSENGVPQQMSRISPYLRDEDAPLIDTRKYPISNVPATGIGNKPIDNGAFLFTQQEMADFISHEPQSAKYFKEWYGADELIKGKKRYFLWLANCPPSELRKMPLCKARIETVRKFRASSTAKSTRDLAAYPVRFHVTNIPDTDFIVIPEVTSEHRDYIPMVYISKEKAAGKLFSNLVKLMPGANMYHFGVLQSKVHMVWTKAICGYKDFRPRYSTEIVFNNFPWPTPNKKTMETIAQSATSILEARNQYPNSSLADLYDIYTMPEPLREAHDKNDAAVLNAYGLPREASDSLIIERLFSMYNALNG